MNTKHYDLIIVGTGSGNSIPSYVPAENYLAMLDETHDVNG